MKQNILLISLDATRPDHLSCYGHSRPTTPNIDALASRGVIFSKAYSGGNWTPPGHATMFTGLYPTSHGALGDNKISPDVPLLSSMLSELGYHSVSFQNAAHLGGHRGLDRDFEDRFELWREKSRRSTLPALSRRLGIFDTGARRSVHTVRRWLDEGWDRKRPFFMFLHMIDPHLPYDAPHPYKYRFLDRREKQLAGSEKIQAVNRNQVGYLLGDVELNRDELGIFAKLYDGELAYMDHWLGRLFDIMKKRGLLDNTQVVLTADHGELLGEHGYLGHVGCVRQELLRVPLIFYGKQIPRTPSVVDSLVTTADIVPTVLRLIGEELDDHYLHGTPLFPLREGYHDFIVAERGGRISGKLRQYLSEKKPVVDIASFTLDSRVLVTKEGQKAVKYSDGKLELFDLNRDPGEKENIAQKNEELAKTLTDRLDTYLGGLRQAEGVVESSVEDEEIRKNLEALGYL